MWRAGTLALRARDLPRIAKALRKLGVRLDLAEQCEESDRHPDLTRAEMVPPAAPASCSGHEAR